MPRPFEIIRRTELDAAEAWDRLTTWERHGNVVPLTTVHREPGTGPGVGEHFVARTALGRVGFDDPMEVVAWEPPREPVASGEAVVGASADPDRSGFCRIEKRGRVLTGWTEITVQPAFDGSVVMWRELAVVPRLGRVGNAAGHTVGRLMFGRVLSRLLADAR